MRLLLKRPLANLWLDLEAPAKDISVTRTINTPGDISCSLPIEYFARKGEDGREVLEEFGTLLIVEHDDGSLDVALVDDISLEEDSVSVSGGGLSMIAKGTPWLGEDKKYELADPVVIFNDIWDHLLSFPQGKVGLKIKGDTSSKGSLGTPDSDEYKKANNAYLDLLNEVTRTENVLKERETTLTNAVSAVFKAVGLHTVGQIKLQKDAPSDTKNIVWVDSDDYNKAYIYSGGNWVLKSGASSQVSAYLDAKSKRDITKNYLTTKRDEMSAADSKRSEVEEGKGEPYEINWYSIHDLQAVVNELIDAGPFDYVEKAEWSGDDLSLSLQVGSPLIGSRRDDLVFELGVNVISHPTLTIHDPHTEVFQLGSGEGSATLRTTRSLPNDGRVRRVYVETDKDARTQQQTNRSADRSLTKVKPRKGFDLDSLTVIDHSFARPSQYGVGDEIHVTGLLPDGSELDVWVRITEMTRTAGDTTIDLKVQVV